MLRVCEFKEIDEGIFKVTSIFKIVESLSFNRPFNDNINTFYIITRSTACVDWIFNHFGTSFGKAIDSGHG